MPGPSVPASYHINERIDPEFDHGDVCIAGAIGRAVAFQATADALATPANPPREPAMRITLSDNATVTFLK